MFLDGGSLSSLDDCFDLMSHSLTHLYLQRNELTTSQGFANLHHIQFITLAHNRIRVLEGLAQLGSLLFLDVSHNLLDELDTGSEEDETTCQIPEQLRVLNIAGNPFVDDASPENLEAITEHIVTVSPYLQRLDGRRITAALRRSYGLEASDDDEDEANDAFAPAAVRAAKKQLASAEDGEEEDEEEEEESFDESEAATAASALRSETEAMKARSQARTKQFDEKHKVSEADTQLDRVEALEAQAAAAAAAAAAAGKKGSKP